MTQYCKAFMHYAKVYFHQVKEAFCDPPRWSNLPQLRTWRVGLLATTLKKDCPGTSLEGATPGSPHTQVAAKLQGPEPWVHITQLKRAPPDSWSFIPARDVRLKQTEEIPPEKQSTS